MVKVVLTIAELKNHLKEIRASGKTIGFVPTMGFLHQGHLSLVKEAKKRSDFVVVSIFVNPTQFGPKEDLAKYPRDIEKDQALLEAEGVNLIFIPEVSEIYSSNFQTFVDVEKVTKKFEGEIRPTHFKGVTTVVSILFNIVKPDFAFFGQKDAQQCAVIKQMVNDLKYDIEVVICAIIREADGLAMSSRNIYLNEEERVKALLLSKSLFSAEEMIRNGERNSLKIKKNVNNFFLPEKTISLNYINIVNSSSFEEVDELKEGEQYFVLIACKLGSTRLIDNLLITI